MKHAYAVVIRHDWATHGVVEVLGTTTAKAEQIVATGHDIPGTYLSVVSGLTIGEMGRMERGYERLARPIPPIPLARAKTHGPQGSEMDDVHAAAVGE